LHIHGYFAHDFSVANAPSSSPCRLGAKNKQVFGSLLAVVNLRYQPNVIRKCAIINIKGGKAIWKARLPQYLRKPMIGISDTLKNCLELTPREELSKKFVEIFAKQSN
jgi:hypothetical protein